MTAACAGAPADDPPGVGPGYSTAPPSERILAVVDGRPITAEDYRDHLERLYGAIHLDDLILRQLLDREAERLGVTVDPAELEREVELFLEDNLVRFQGDRDALEDELALRGLSVETYLDQWRFELHKRLLTQGLCRATREIREEDVMVLFEDRFGREGVRVEVRHLLLTLPRTQALLRLEGADEEEFEPERVHARMARDAEALLERWRAGESLEDLAREASADISVHQNGGRIPGYNYERYGPELAQAVRAAAVGAINEPVWTSAGLHLFQVESRETTDLESVRGELEAELGAALPTSDEIAALEARLRAAASIEKP